jgi:hypothetical protein
MSKKDDKKGIDICFSFGQHVRPNSGGPFWASFWGTPPGYPKMGYPKWGTPGGTLRDPPKPPKMPKNPKNAQKCPKTLFLSLFGPPRPPQWKNARFCMRFGMQNRGVFRGEPILPKKQRFLAKWGTQGVPPYPWGGRVPYPATG